MLLHAAMLVLMPAALAFELRVSKRHVAGSASGASAPLTRAVTTTMGLRQRVRAQLELRRLLGNLATDLRETSDERDVRRLRVRLRRARRRVDRSVTKISADVEAEMLAARDGVSLPSLNKIRQQIAASMTRDGKLGSASSEAIGVSMQRSSDPREAGLRAKPVSDLRLEGRRVAVVTTAALPWMTGEQPPDHRRASSAHGPRACYLPVPPLQIASATYTHTYTHIYTPRQTPCCSSLEGGRGRCNPTCVEH